jgi:hypothetical protein
MPCILVYGGDDMNKKPKGRVKTGPPKDKRLKGNKPRPKPVKKKEG